MALNNEYNQSIKLLVPKKNITNKRIAVLRNFKSKTDDILINKKSVINITDTQLKAIIHRKNIKNKIYHSHDRLNADRLNADRLNRIAEVKEINTEMNGKLLKTASPIIQTPIAHDMVEFIRTKTGFLVEKKIADFEKFKFLIELANAIFKESHNASIKLYGSIVHYFVWYSYQSNNYTPDEAMRIYFESGLHIPNDIDIYDPYNRLFTIGISLLDTYSEIELKSNDNRYAASNIIGRKYTVTKKSFVDIDILIDVTNKIHSDNIDFRINGLAIDKQQGLHILHQKYSMYDNTINKCIDEFHEINHIVSDIKYRRSEFIGKFNGGPNYSNQRKKLINRFRKMIDHGINIIGFDEYYPKKIISKYDIIIAKELIKCIICQDEIKVNSTVRVLECAGKMTSNFLCNECFWSHLYSRADEDRYYKCPLCRETKPLFENQSNSI